MKRPRREGHTFRNSPQQILTSYLDRRATLHAAMQSMCMMSMNKDGVDVAVKICCNTAICEKLLEVAMW